jgi:type I restriction enzyme M protein
MRTLGEQLALPDNPIVDDRSVLARRFDDLHELIYRRGGIRPVNAAIDELCKLLLLHVHAQRHPAAIVDGIPFSDLLDPARIRSGGERAVANLRAGFDAANSDPDYQWRQNGDRGFFVEGDTLRLSETEVLAEAAALVTSIPVVTSRTPIDLRLRQEDLTGLAFEVFLRGRYQHAGGLGTYLTPEPVVEAMTRMALAHVPDARFWAEDLLIGDPCAGTGRFLVAAMRHAEARVIASATSPTGAASRAESMRESAFLGADQADSSLLKARLNFLMYGVNRPRLFRVDDSITSPKVRELVGTFDVILTNPPFGAGKYDRPEGLAVMRDKALSASAGWVWQRGASGTRRPVKRADPAVLFWDYDLSLLRPGGVLAVVLPDGVLGPKYAWLHDALIRQVNGSQPKAELLAVVSLPRQTFALSGTVAKTSFLLLRRLPAGRSSRGVFVARSQHVGYIQRGPSLVADPEGNDLDLIANAYISALHAGGTPDGPWSFVPLADMRRSIDAHGSSSIEPSADGIPTIGELAGLRRSRARRRSPTDSFFLSILHVGSDCLVDWVDAFSYSPKTPGKECHPGDVLVSCLNPQIPRITFIPDDSGVGLCSAEFAVLRPENISAAALALLLRSEDITASLSGAGRGTSTSRRRIDAGQILSQPAPPALLMLARTHEKEFSAAVVSDRTARLGVATVLRRLQQPPRSPRH